MPCYEFVNNVNNLPFWVVLQLQDDKISSYLLNVNGEEKNVNGKRKWDDFQLSFG